MLWSAKSWSRNATTLYLATRRASSSLPASESCESWIPLTSAPMELVMPSIWTPSPSRLGNFGSASLPRSWCSNGLRAGYLRCQLAPRKDNDLLLSFLIVPDWEIVRITCSRKLVWAVQFDVVIDLAHGWANVFICSDTTDGLEMRLSCWCHDFRFLSIYRDLIIHVQMSNASLIYEVLFNGHLQSSAVCWSTSLPPPWDDDPFSSWRSATAYQWRWTDGCIFSAKNISNVEHFDQKDCVMFLVESLFNWVAWHKIHPIIEYSDVGWGQSRFATWSEHRLRIPWSPSNSVTLLDLPCILNDRICWEQGCHKSNRRTHDTTQQGEDNEERHDAVRASLFAMVEYPM